MKDKQEKQPTNSPWWLKSIAVLGSLSILWTLTGVAFSATGCQLGVYNCVGALYLDVAGNVGIGVPSPNDKLDVAGNLRILTGSNPVRITAGWTGFTDAVTNQAEISNDTGTYKTLMIVGNKSNDGATRRVSVWDRLEVNGNANVSGTIRGATYGFGGMYQCDKRGCGAGYDSVNPLTGGYSCPSGFNVNLVYTGKSQYDSNVYFCWK